jgi:hypothetical protein
VPVEALAGLGYPRRGEDERLYLDSMVVVVVLVTVLKLSLAGTGMLLRRSWSFAVWAEGALESELRRGGSGGALPLVMVFLRRPTGCEGKRTLPNMTVSR